MALATWTTHDPILLILLALLTPLAMARLVLMAVHWREVVRPELTITRARQLQRRCAVVYFAFAVVLGMFGSRVLQLPWPDLHMLIVAILIGYGAGMQPTSACGRESRFRT